MPFTQASAFIILEAATIIFPSWGFPDWTIDLVLWLLILGAFINVIIAWIYDITPGGMQRTKPLEEASTKEKDSRFQGMESSHLCQPGGDCGSGGS